VTPPPAPFLVTDDNRLECQTRGGAILWLYVHAVSSYGGIGHNLDYETIGYRNLFCARVADRSDRPLAGSTDPSLIATAGLLGRGALFALCCELYDLLSDEQRSEEVREFLEAWQGAEEISALPLARDLIDAALPALAAPPDCRWERTPAGARLRRVMDSVYLQHVAGFLRDLAARATAR
jgi:hypothetical protein